MCERYVNQIKILDSEIKRLNERAKKLREEKKSLALHVSNYMEANNLESYQGLKLSSIKPKQKTGTKPPKEKRKDGIDFFNSLGVNDPLSAYEEFVLTQKKINQI